jgi:hypothetical protein
LMKQPTGSPCSRPAASTTFTTATLTGSMR